MVTSILEMLVALLMIIYFLGKIVLRKIVLYDYLVFVIGILTFALNLFAFTSYL